MMSDLDDVTAMVIITTLVNLGDEHISESTAKIVKPRYKLEDIENWQNQQIVSH